MSLEYKHVAPDETGESISELEEMIVDGAVEEQVRAFVDYVNTYPESNIRLNLVDNPETLTIRIDAYFGRKDGIPPYRDIGMISLQTMVTESLRDGKTGDLPGKVRELYVESEPFTILVDHLCDILSGTSINPDPSVFQTSDITHYTDPRYNNGYFHMEHDLHAFHPPEPED